MLDLHRTLVPFWGFLLASLLVFVAAAFISFAYWIKRRPSLSVDECTKSWEIFIKSIATVIAVVSGTTALLQYLDQRDRELTQQSALAAQRTREVNIQLYNTYGDAAKQRNAIFHEAVDVVATLATEKDLKSDNFRIARQRFDRLYWGELCMTESSQERDSTIGYSNVASCMIKFRDALDGLERTGIRVPWQQPESLEHLSKKLAYACQEDLDRLSTARSK